MARLRDVRGLRARSTATPPIGASTRNRSPAPTAVPGWSSWTVAAVPVRRTAVRGDDAALAHTRRRLAAGGVLAVKGLGGYHLVCDARNEAAVAELRRESSAADKPFAVMVGDLGSRPAGSPR